MQIGLPRACMHLSDPIELQWTVHDQGKHLRPTIGARVLHRREVLSILRDRVYTHIHLQLWEVRQPRRLLVWIHNPGLHRHPSRTRNPSLCPLSQNTSDFLVEPSLNPQILTLFLPLARALLSQMLPVLSRLLPSISHLSLL